MSILTLWPFLMLGHGKITVHDMEEFQFVRLVRLAIKEVVMEMQFEQAGDVQPKIIRVEAFDGDTFGITLDSGHTILLELGDRIHEPAFSALIQSGDFCKPYTDGENLCWPGGMSLTLKEILGMLLSQGNAKQNQYKEVFE